MDSHQSPMNTEFAVEWKGFTANEKRKLKTLWSRLQFPPEFCALFTAEVYKGKPGEDGGIFVHAKSFRIFRQHWMVSLGFAGLEDLVGLARTVVLDASNCLWYCNRCGRPAPLGQPCGWCPETQTSATAVQ